MVDIAALRANHTLHRRGGRCAEQTGVSGLYDDGLLDEPPVATDRAGEFTALKSEHDRLSGFGHSRCSRQRPAP